ncbi:hypothetical protein, partial [Olivibacter jilunii]
QERLSWRKGHNLLPVQSYETVCLKIITPQTFGMIRSYFDSNSGKLILQKKSSTGEIEDF